MWWTRIHVRSAQPIVLGVHLVKATWINSSMRQTMTSMRHTMTSMRHTMTFFETTVFGLVVRLVASRAPLLTSLRILVQFCILTCSVTLTHACILSCFMTLWMSLKLFLGTIHGYSIDVGCLCFWNPNSGRIHISFLPAAGPLWSVRQIMVRVLVKHNGVLHFVLDRTKLLDIDRLRRAEL